MITPKFVYGLTLRIAMNISGKINGEKYEISQSGSCIIVDFPDRKQMVEFTATDLVQDAYAFALKHPEETWDKGRGK